MNNYSAEADWSLAVFLNALSPQVVVYPLLEYRWNFTLKSRTRGMINTSTFQTHICPRLPHTPCSSTSPTPRPAPGSVVFMFTVLLHVRPIMQMEDDMIPQILPVNGSIERPFIYLLPFSALGCGPARKRHEELQNFPMPSTFTYILQTFVFLSQWKNIAKLTHFQCFIFCFLYWTLVKKWIDRAFRGVVHSTPKCKSPDQDSNPG